MPFVPGGGRRRQSQQIVRRGARVRRGGAGVPGRRAAYALRRSVVRSHLSPRRDSLDSRRNNNDVGEAQCGRSWQPSCWPSQPRAATSVRRRAPTAAPAAVGAAAERIPAAACRTRTARSRAPRRFPLRDHAVTQHPVGGVGPTDVEQQGIDRIFGCALHHPILVCLYHTGLHTGEKAGAHGDRLRSEAERGHETSAVGDPSRWWRGPWYS